MTNLSHYLFIHVLNNRFTGDEFYKYIYDFCYIQENLST